MDPIFLAGLALGAVMFLLALGLAIPALLIAIATACFCGFPCFISVRILDEIVFCDLPDFNGMITPMLINTKFQDTVQQSHQ